MLLTCPAPVSAQRLAVHVQAGLTQSTPLLRSGVTTPALAQLLGSPVDEEVRVTAAPGPTGVLGVRVSFWRTVGLTAEGEWTRTELRAEDGSGERSMQDLDVLHTAIGVAWSARPFLELGAGAGLIWYRTAEEGVFADGSDVSPTLALRLAWIPPVVGGRLALTGTAQTHRFGTPVIRAADGIDGDVARVSIGVRVRVAEVGL